MGEKEACLPSVYFPSFVSGSSLEAVIGLWYESKFTVPPIGPPSGLCVEEDISSLLKPDSQFDKSTVVAIRQVAQHPSNQYLVGLLGNYKITDLYLKGRQSYPIPIAFQLPFYL